MQIRCANCGQGVAVADTGVLPASCPNCSGAPVPDRLGRFRVVRLLAAGGMGEVYLGEHEDLGTRVALKLLPVAGGDDAGAVRERFRREALLTAAIGHPGVVHVLDLAEDRGRLFLVLELVDGRSLRSRLRDGALPAPEAVRIAVAAAEVLGAAHKGGVVHRDVKPENVMLASDGRVRVLDFGIARALQDHQPLTRTGELLGTPQYMAPEQLLDTAESVDARADVHALGVLAWELLTGRSPFAGQNVFSTLKLVESLVPPPPSRFARDVPPAVDAVVLQALAKDKQQRPADGAAFAAALVAAWGAPLGAPHPIAAERRRWLTISAVLVLAALALAPWMAPWSAAGAPSRDGDVAAAAAAASEVDALVASPVLPASDHGRLRALLGQLPSDGTAAGLLRSGAARLRLGEFHGALVDLERAHRLGEPRAQAAAGVAWHATHTLLPALAAAPEWLSLVDRERRDRLFGIAAPGSDGAKETDAPKDELVRAGRQLALRDAAGAWHSLAQLPTDAWTEEHALLAVIAARSCCADHSQFERAAARIAAVFHSPAVQLACASRTDSEVQLEAHVRRLAATSADRWLGEMFLVSLQARRGATRPERLRAAAELAWYTGADALAPIWCAALQLTVAAETGASLGPADAARLRDLVRGLSADDHAALCWVLAWVERIVDGPAAAQRLLASLPAVQAEPGCAALRAWSHAPDRLAPLFAASLTALAGDVPVPDANSDATACALWAWAAAPGGDEALRQCRAAWDRALTEDADVACVPAWRTPHAGSLQALAAALAAAAERTAAASSPAFVAALRLAVAAGADVGSLRTTFDAEITRGVQ